jgi:hypothetical protein
MTTEPDPTPETTEKPDRRAILAALIAGVAAGSIVSADDARAQIPGFGDGGIELPDEFFELILRLLEAFTTVAIWQFPPFVRAILNDILAIIGSSDDSVAFPESVDGALESSYPTAPVTTRAAQEEAAIFQGQATRRRVSESCRACATPVAAQVPMAIEEEAIVAAAQVGAGAPGAGHVALLAGILRLQAMNNQRIGHLTTQMAAIAQLLADPTIRDGWAKEQGMLLKEAYFSGAGDDVAPPVVRNAR